MLLRALRYLDTKVLVPEYGPAGFHAALKEWSRSASPSDQRRAMVKMLGFIVELATAVFFVSGVACSMHVHQNGRPSDVRFAFAAPGGKLAARQFVLKLLVTNSFGLEFKLVEGERVETQGKATAEFLGRILKSLKNGRQRQS